MANKDSSALSDLIASLGQPPQPKRKPIIQDPLGQDVTESYPPEFYGSSTPYTQREPLNSPKAAVAAKAAPFNPLRNVLKSIGDYTMVPITAMNHILDSILKDEGKVANYKEDKGGYTNRGITAKALAEYKGVDPKTITPRDIDKVSPELAKDIYKTMYIDKAGYGNVDDPDVLHLLADMSVHHGRAGSAELTQKALNKLGYKVSVDGDFGPKSKAALETAIAKKGKNYVLKALVDQRQERFKEIIKRDPTQVRFKKGWDNRAERFMPAEFKKETKKS